MVSLSLFVLVPLFAAVFIYLLPEKIVRVVGLFVQAALFAASLILFVAVQAQGYIEESLGGWVVFSGITLGVDLLSAIMLVMTTGLFFLFLLYNASAPYVRNLFLTLFLILQCLLSGIFISTDLFNVYVLIEVGTIVVTLLILFKQSKRILYDGLIYLMINIVSMSFFLLGLGMLYRLVGVLDFATIGERAAQLESQQLILPCALMLTAACLKAAAFPVFSWLPKAHGTPGAPSVVSAVLSGLYVKSGIYLILRLQGIFAEVFDLRPFFLGLGLVTAFAGIILALSQRDIKRILAYSTVSQMGLILLGLGQGTPHAYHGALYHVINHALFKSLLFLVAGLIIEVYGTRDLHRIRGVARKMPLPAITAIVAMLGVTGAPFFNGSLSKYLIESDLQGSLFAYGLIAINFGTVLYFLRFLSMFKGAASQETQEKIPLNRQAVLVVFAMLCLGGGFFGSFFMDWIFGVDIAFPLPVALEKGTIYLATVAAGIVLHRVLDRPLTRLTHRLQLEPGFNEMCLAILVLFAVQVFYLNGFAF